MRCRSRTEFEENRSSNQPAALRRAPGRGGEKSVRLPVEKLLRSRFAFYAANIAKPQQHNEPCQIKDALTFAELNLTPAVAGK